MNENNTTVTEVEQTEKKPSIFKRVIIGFLIIMAVMIIRAQYINYTVAQEIERITPTVTRFLQNIQQQYVDEQQQLINYDIYGMYTLKNRSEDITVRRIANPDETAEWYREIDAKMTTTDGYQYFTAVMYYDFLWPDDGTFIATHAVQWYAASNGDHHLVWLEDDWLLY